MQQPRMIADLDLSPPDWIVRLLSTQDRTVPWRDMIRGALSVGAPLAVGYAGGHLAYGVLMAIGTLPGMLADRGGPVADRVRRAVMGLLAGSAGLVLGHIMVGSGWPAIVAVAVLSLAAGLVSPLGATASFASLQLLVYIAIGSGFVVPLAPQELVLLFFVGGAWAMLLSFIEALLEGVSSPETDAVVAVYCAIVSLLETCGTDETVAERQQLTAVLNTAYDQVVGARSRMHGRDRRLRWLGNMLNAATVLSEASVAVVRTEAKPPRAEIDALSRLAGAIRSGADAADRFVPSETPSPQLHALNEAIARAFRRLESQGEHPSGRASLRARLEQMLDAGIDMVTARQNWVYALRLALCMTAAEAVREVVPIQRPYWILLTVAIVVKPDFGSVFARAVQRGGGTVVGVLVGAVLLAVLPLGPPIIAAIAILAGLLPLGIRRNYGLLATFVTPLALILIDLATNQGVSLIAARLEATLTGCAIVLVLGYLLWPETWRSRLAERISQSIESLTSYLAVAYSGDEAERIHRRRAVYRGLSEARTELQRMLSEPPPFNRRAAAWWPVVNGLERVADAVAEASVTVRETSSPPPAGDVQSLIHGLENARRSLTDHAAPGSVDEIADPRLIGVRDEIAGVLGLLEGETGNAEPDPLRGGR
jgi:uncharacterized membrane protein YccC